MQGLSTPTRLIDSSRMPCSGVSAHLTPTKRKRRKKDGTITNYLCLNLSILSMCFVDTWKAWSQTTGSNCLQADFYSALAEELIDNTYDQGVGGTGARARAGASNNLPNSPLFHHATGQPRELGLMLT